MKGKLLLLELSVSLLHMITRGIRNHMSNVIHLKRRAYGLYIQSKALTYNLAIFKYTYFDFTFDQHINLFYLSTCLIKITSHWTFTTKNNWHNISNRIYHNHPSIASQLSITFSLLIRHSV